MAPPRRRPCARRRRHQGRVPAPGFDTIDMPPWPTPRHPPGGRAHAARCGSRWISTIPTIPSRKARGTARSRTTFARTAKSRQTQRDTFRAAHRAGVRMVFGSDAGVMPHGQGRPPVRHDGDLRHAPLQGDPRGHQQRGPGARPRPPTSEPSRSAAMATSSRSPAIRWPMSECWKRSMQ